jgi:Putative zinc-finger
MEHLTEREVIALRTQSASADEAFTLLEHAGSCAMCSERVMSKGEMVLQMASLQEVLRGSASHLSLDEMNDFVDGSLLPQEKARLDEHLAACSSCSTLVLELKEMARPVPAFQPKQLWFTQRIGAFFTLPRMMGATALIMLAVALTSWVLMRHRVVEPQIAKRSTPAGSASEVGRVQTEAGSQAGGPGNKKTLPGGETEPAQGAKARGSMLAITLMPGIVRGENTERTLHLPERSDGVLLTLNSRAELTPGRYRVSLTDHAGHRVWRGDVVYRNSPDAVIVRVPADLLVRGRYVVTLSVAEGGGTSESLEEYALVITR